MVLLGDSEILMGALSSREDICMSYMTYMSYIVFRYYIHLTSFKEFLFGPFTICDFCRTSAKNLLIPWGHSHIGIKTENQVIMTTTDVKVQLIWNIFISFIVSFYI